MVPARLNVEAVELIRWEMVASGSNNFDCTATDTVGLTPYSLTN